jgi:hypothetical protein
MPEPQTITRTIRSVTFTAGSYDGAKAAVNGWDFFTKQWPDAVLVATRGAFDTVGLLGVEEWCPFITADDKPPHEDRLVCLELDGDGRRRVVLVSRVADAVEVGNAAARGPAAEHELMRRSAFLLRNALDLASQAWPDASQVELDHLVSYCPHPWPAWHTLGLVNGLVHHLANRPHSRLRTMVANHGLTLEEVRGACDAAATGRYVEPPTVPDRDLLPRGRALAAGLPTSNSKGWRLRGVGVLQLARE